MPAPKGNKYAKGNPGGGRPSRYRAEYAEQARKLCLLGYTDAELAQFFEVGETTLGSWKKDHKEFLEALKKGKSVADANVADRLYQRAMGYEHPEVDIRVVDNIVVQTPITKIYAPDPASAIFWLKNRQRGKWRDKIDTEVTGADGGPVGIAVNVKFE
jgi:hypothetical protein